MRKIVLTLIATVALLGCSDEPTPVAPDEQKAIGFGNVDTRAGLSDLQNEGFGVWAVVSNDILTSHVLMDNCEVTFDTTTSKWVYSPVKYWIDNSVFTFLAAYPYNNSNFSCDTDSKTIMLTVVDTPSEVDYLYATNVTDTGVEDYSKEVPLQFHHALTSVGLNIWRDEAKHTNDQMRVRKVTLSNIRMKGTGTFPTDTNSNSWVYTNDKLTLVYTNDEVADDDNIGAAMVKDDGALETSGIPAKPFDGVMLLPQTLDADNNVSLKIVYELKRQNAADWEEAELETVLPSMTWGAGKRYTYNVVLSSVTDITVYYIQTKVDPWGTPQVGGTVIIK